MWCNIEAAGEIWHWSLSGVKELMHTYMYLVFIHLSSVSEIYLTHTLQAVLTENRVKLYEEYQFSVGWNTVVIQYMDHEMHIVYYLKQIDRWIGGWWMDGWMDGWVDGWMDGWVGGWVGGWMDESIIHYHLITIGGARECAVVQFARVLGQSLMAAPPDNADHTEIRDNLRKT